VNKHRSNNCKKRRKYKENFPNTDGHLHYRIVFWGSTYFCFDSFGTRLGKNSGAENTEKNLPWQWD